MDEYLPHQVPSHGMTTSAREQAKTSISIPRLNSKELMQHSREVEIDHEGRIYRLRVTQLNKLILTA
ncbi:hemin uptake protein HemP [Undibacterium sp. Dicai25W]|uniref:hemin uptake protein HemP n=1 Tax=Undibacterium sp. Dicai25W TaxID=3413034 RepID=UPI003BEF9819